MFYLEYYIISSFNLIVSQVVQAISDIIQISVFEIPHEQQAKLDHFSWTN